MVTFLPLTHDRDHIYGAVVATSSAEREAKVTEYLQSDRLKPSIVESFHVDGMFIATTSEQIK